MSQLDRILELSGGRNVVVDFPTKKTEAKKPELSDLILSIKESDAFLSDLQIQAIKEGNLTTQELIAGLQAEIEKTRSAIGEFQQFAEESKAMHEAMMGLMGKMIDTLKLPVKPVYDAKGKLLYARRSEESGE